MSDAKQTTITEEEAKKIKMQNLRDAAKVAREKRDAEEKANPDLKVQRLAKAKEKRELKVQRKADAKEKREQKEAKKAAKSEKKEKSPPKEKTPEQLATIAAAVAKRKATIAAKKAAKITE